ncbi:MAG: hypothetical protein AAFV98_03655 [Chloroflexota bacterium]
MSQPYQHDPLIQSSQFAHNDNGGGSDNRQEERIYRAFNMANRRQTKIMLYNMQGFVMGMPSYTHYVDAICVDPQEIWIVFSTGVFRCVGEYLSIDILVLLQDDRLRSLHCFHSAMFDMPEDGSPIIHEIQRYSLQDYRQKALNEQAQR